MPRSLASAALPRISPTISGEAIRERSESANSAARACRFGEVAQRLVGLPEFEQTGDGVHAVGELVLLGPQRVGQAADAVELAQQPGHLGAVAQGDDRAVRSAGERRPASG